MSIFIYFTINNITKIMDEDIDFMRVLFTVLMCLGCTQMLLKNYAIIPFHEEVESLLNWILGHHEKTEDDEIIQKVSQEEFAKALRYSMLFFRIFFAMFMVTAIICSFKFALSDYLIIAIPGLNPDATHFIHKLLTIIFTYVVASWTVFSDMAIVFIGIYIIFFLKSINKLINIFGDNSDTFPKFLLCLIRKHVEMIRVLHIFNDIMKFISLVQLISSTLTFLVVIFYIQLFPNYLLLHIMLVSLLIQLALLCFFGEIIRSESKEIFKNLYQTNWYDLSLKDQKIILLMMTNSLQVIGLKAGGLYDIGLMSLVQVRVLYLT
ncbi:odorant receptor 85c-like [Lutzomyia longipalpis]|uniref:odorant receptor 85c-like n=1 Tax=Lutzomyia longipalpis TaxID=7200 RepID=UPI002484236B|nr:odorant receptor 85c-like [Lutzomyia longipalpis]